MTDKQELSHEDYIHAKMVAAAMQASGVFGTLEAQIQEGIKTGKVTIAQAAEHKKTLAANAARTMAMGIEAALNVLNQEGYQIVRVEKNNQSSGDGTGPVPASGDGEARYNGPAVGHAT